MTRKHRRLAVLLACGVGLGSATALALSAFSSSVSFFVTPSQLARAAGTDGGGRTFRLGGLVEAGSLRKTMEAGHPAARFTVSDGKAAVTVRYVGILPDLFREGQGIVAMGTLAPDGSFRADEVLAKHDATYMPKDVADALKASGHWNPAAGPPPPASTWNTLVPKQVGG